MTSTCINILQSYRKHCASVSSSGQLILPEALKLLPLYTLGMISCLQFASLLFAFISISVTIKNIFIDLSALIKSVGLRTDGRLDDRSYWVSTVSSISVLLAIPLVFPRMIPLHDLASRVRTVNCFWQSTLFKR